MTKRFTALTLCLMLLFSVCLPAQADVTLLDTALSRWFQAVPEAHFTAGLKVEALAPFADDTVSLLNSFLANVTLTSQLTFSGADSQTKAQLSLGGVTAADWTESLQNGAYAFTTSLLPKRTLTSAKTSPMDVLTGGSAETGAAAADAAQAFSFLDAIDQLQQCYQALTDGIQPYATEKKANYNIKGVGKGAWSRVARLTQEQSQNLLTQLRNVLSCGMDTAYRALIEKLTFEKGLVVALYRNADGQDLCVYIKGNATDADGNRRRLSFQWAFATNGLERTDTYKYELIKAVGAQDSRSVSATCSQTGKSDVFSIACDAQTTLKLGKTKDDGRLVIDLKGKQAQSGELTCAGKISRSQTQTADDMPVKTENMLEADLRLTPDSEGNLLSGTLKTTDTKDDSTVNRLVWTLASPDTTAAAQTAQPVQTTKPKQAKNGVTVNILTSDVPQDTDTPAPEATVPASSLAKLQETAATAAPSPTPTAAPQTGAAYLVGATPESVQAYPTPSAETAVDMDTATADTVSALLAEASQNLAGKLLLAVATLPEASRALLKDGMTDADYAAFDALLGAL